MKNSRLIFLVIIPLILSCTSDINVDYPDYDPNFPNSNCLQGQGTIVSETRVLNDFHSVRNTTFADIYITQGPKEDVALEAQPNVLRELETEVIDGVLTLKLNRCVNSVQAVKVYITIPEIRSLIMTGAGETIAQNEFDTTELEVILTGVGDFYLQGTTTTLDITLTGVGGIKAFELISNTCDVNITGVGDVELFVNDELNVTIEGTGNVYYKGNPSINSTIAGTGSIVDAN